MGANCAKVSPGRCYRFPIADPALTGHDGRLTPSRRPSKHPTVKRVKTASPKCHLTRPASQLSRVGAGDGGACPPTGGMCGQGAEGASQKCHLKRRAAQLSRVGAGDGGSCPTWWW